MNGEKLFGGPARAPGHNDHDGLKLVLHRYIIDAIEESGKTCWKARANPWRSW